MDDERINLDDNTPRAREVHEQWANEVRSECEEIKKKADQTKSEIEAQQQQAASIIAMMTGSEVDVANLLKEPQK